MHLNSNLSYDEIERMAYMRGGAGPLFLARVLEEAAEAQSALDAIADHGITDAQEAAALNGDLNAERKEREKAEERVQELENVLAELEHLLHDATLRMTKGRRETLAGALENVRVDAGYSGSADAYLRAVLHEMRA